MARKKNKFAEVTRAARKGKVVPGAIGPLPKRARRAKEVIIFPPPPPPTMIEELAY